MLLELEPLSLPPKAFGSFDSACSVELPDLRKAQPFEFFQLKKQAKLKLAEHAEQAEASRPSARAQQTQLETEDRQAKESECKHSIIIAARYQVETHPPLQSTARHETMIASLLEQLECSRCEALTCRCCVVMWGTHGSSQVEALKEELGDAKAACQALDPECFFLMSA